MKDNFYGFAYSRSPQEIISNLDCTDFMDIYDNERQIEVLSYEYGNEVYNTDWMKRHNRTLFDMDRWRSRLGKVYTRKSSIFPKTW